MDHSDHSDPPIRVDPRELRSDLHADQELHALTYVTRVYVRRCRKNRNKMFTWIIRIQLIPPVNSFRGSFLNECALCVR